MNYGAIFRTLTVVRHQRERRTDGQLRTPSVELPDDDAAKCLRAYGEYEASRLFLAALGRRHGPVD